MVWLYLWPTGGHWNVLQTFPFYIGLLSCTLPFNLLMFGMNDMVDFDVDQLHARKGNYTWGARASKLELAQLPLMMAISNLCPMVILVAATGHMSSLIWVLGFFLCNITYNLPPMAVARKGPWEFPCMLLGISCITMFSCDVNNVPTPSIGGWMFHWLAMARGQLFGEILDIEDDAQVGKNTTAVKIGGMRSQQLMFALTVCLALVSYILVGSVVLTVYYVVDMVLSVFSRKGVVVVPEKYTLLIFKARSALGVSYMFFAWCSQVLA
ncbi:hypothetical protein FOZ63_025817 [Perkinsus olseni]|uniref:UbiA prenyltransferase domain-containing protein 1 n=1 Tax=Perkinsus olseni TaxID=32597 RepID=A0A7J6Q5X9_PEROL|nr:hypothetical protein FOZ63_025817 [Perkinsus olseni]KAF4738086.1 hypothetical protein FOZ62_027960 [Perkinsus olseni]